MIDLTATITNELRAIAADWPSPHTDYPIRTRELEPEDTPKGGKAPRIILLRRLPITRRRREPLAEYLYRADVYHPDPVLVSTVAGLVSDAFHDIGPRVATLSGVRIGIYSSGDIGNSGALIEPGTRYPLERVTFRFMAPTVALT